MKKRKVILITGGSSGIGYDAAQALARQGHCVYAAARRVERMEPLREDGVRPLRMDVTDEKAMQEAVNTILREEGRIDVLINNAGYGYFGAIESVSLEDARKQLEVNLFGLARLTQLVLPAMRAQGSGRIINTSSIAGKAVVLFGGWYNVSKFAVEALSDALRMEVKPQGIDVIKIQPGAVRTDWGGIAAKHLAESTEGTPYQAEGQRFSHTMDWFFKTKLPCPPARIVRAISRAVNSSHPRIRYRLGTFSKTGVFLHAILPARWWDALNRLGGKL